MTGGEIMPGVLQIVGVSRRVIPESSKVRDVPEQLHGVVEEARGEGLDTPIIISIPGPTAELFAL